MRRVLKVRVHSRIRVFDHKRGGYWTGLKHSPSTIEKMRLIHTGMKASEESKIKRSLALKGRKLGPLEITLARLNAWGKKRGVQRPEMQGSKHPSWQGGITPVNRLIRKHRKMLDWRDSVICLADYKCEWCGATEHLEADHIKRFSSVIKKNKITTVQEGLDYEELWDLRNGRALCEKCHKKRHVGDGSMRY